MNKKVCVVIASRANYGRSKSIMKAIQNHPELELQSIVGASTLLERFGRAVDVIKSEGFIPDSEIFYVVEGETLVTQAKSTGLGIIELATAFDKLDSDVVVTIADRFETMSTAIAATYLNKPLVHIQGGEISGNIDDRVRHAVTKLADVHFPSTELSRKRVIRMGEDPEYVFNFGCPSIDPLVNNELSITNEVMSRYGGVGKPIDWEKPYILMVQHPVTTSYGQGRQQIQTTLDALNRFPDIQKVVLWPNIDAGSDDVSKGIRVFREHNMEASFHYFKNFTPEDYARVLNGAICCVGNSSSFIREGAFLGVPAVLVGDRQRGREHGVNVIEAMYDEIDIVEKLMGQLRNGRYASDLRFGCGNTGEKIASRLAEIDFSFQKKNTY